MCVERSCVDVITLRSCCLFRFYLKEFYFCDSLYRFVYDLADWAVILAAQTVVWKMERLTFERPTRESLISGIKDSNISFVMIIKKQGVECVWLFLALTFPENGRSDNNSIAPIIKHQSLYSEHELFNQMPQNFASQFDSPTLLNSEHFIFQTQHPTTSTSKAHRTEMQIGSCVCYCCRVVNFNIKVNTWLITCNLRQIHSTLPTPVNVMCGVCACSVL